MKGFKLYLVAVVKTFLMFLGTSLAVILPITYCMENNFQEEQRKMVSENKEDYIFLCEGKVTDPDKIDLEKYKLKIDTTTNVVYLK